ncbi:hypothetical protein A9Q86_05475 [Flavobacteriales bacterium 33_180_T64]|nr:hypothetical protein A9Q86_05475 [Flavobacteriales bacterium 33_180_T64]
MHTDNSIIKDIFRDLPFSKEEVKIIESVFHKEKHKKGAFLLKENENVDKQYYISSGCLRSYHIDPQGKEYTVQFGVKDWWISDYTAYFSTSKSIMNIEVLRDTTLYMLSNDNKEYLYTQIPKIETFFRKKLERAFAAFQRRILSNLSQTAAVRYTNFINTYPNIERSVKNYHIASYLGITTESLSRIRKELANN